MESIVTLIVGIIIIVLGILNTKGNISFLHSYHTKNVKEEDRLPFGKKVVLGTIILGIGLILMGVLSFLSDILTLPILLYIGFGVMGVGIVVGLIIIFGAMIKYNKGIF